MSLGAGEPGATTRLFLEMLVCAEFLHMPHGEFRALSRHEQKKWLLFARVRQEKAAFEARRLAEGGGEREAPALSLKGKGRGDCGRRRAPPLQRPPGM